MTTNLLETNDDVQINIDTTKNYLAELVGDDKKFKTQEDLARGKYEADMFIQIQNKRMDELRKDYLALREENMSRANLKEIVDQLTQQRSLTSSVNTPANEVPTEKPPIDLKDIEALVSRRLSENEQTKKQEENFRIVETKLKERFGNNYANVLKSQVDTLRLSAEDVNALARKSPDAFFRLMGLDQQQQEDTFQNPPRSSQRSDSFAPKVQKRTWSFYQNIKRENPTLYFDPKTSEQMIKDAKALGKEFEDGDYHNI